MPAKKIIIALVAVIVLVGGFIAGLALIRQRQEIREEAAVPGGQAQVSIFPSSGNFDVGDSFPASVYFNTANIPISGIAVRLTYTFSGVDPEIAASDVQISPQLLTTGDWTCPTKNVSAQSGSVNIEIACANISAAGFATTADTLLATFNLTANRTPVTNPTTVRFDPSQSVISRKSDGQDILLVPTSTGTYTISGQAVATPTPIQVLTPTPTTGVTGTPTVTPKATPTPTVKATATPTATGAAQLPDAGVSYPTILGIGLGLLLIFGALVLAL